MVWLLFESFLGLLGVVVLVTGRFPWTRNRVVEGGSGRVAGCLLLLPLIVGTGGAFTFQFVMADNALTDDRDLSADEIREAWWVGLGLHAAAVTAAAAFICLIAATNAKPPHLPKALGGDLGRDDRPEGHQPSA